MTAPEEEPDHWANDHVPHSDADSGVFIDELRPLSARSSEMNPFGQITASAQGFDNAHENMDPFPDVDPLHFGYPIMDKQEQPPVLYAEDDNLLIEPDLSTLIRQEMLDEVEFHPLSLDSTQKSQPTQQLGLPAATHDN